MNRPTDDDRRIPGEPISKVRFQYHRMVCSYPRFGADAPYNAPGLGGVRIPRPPEYSFQNGNVWYTRSQATLGYGQNTVNLCNAYGVEVLTGWWDKFDFTPWNHFTTSVRAVPNLGALRLAYMLGILRYHNPERGFPDTVGAILAKVAELAPDMANRNRYAYINDAANTSRPMLLFWGNIENAAAAAAFKRMVMSRSAQGLKGIRQIVEEKTGVTPFLIASQHNSLGAHFEDVTTSVDAFYQHEITIPPLNQTISTAASIPGTQQMIQSSINYLSGKRSAATNLPVYFQSGAMPQFSSLLVGGNTHGVVRAGSKLEVQRMFEMVRNNAQTLYTTGAPARLTEHQWVAISTLAEHAEGTSIEPSLVRPGGVPGGAYNQFSDYGTDFMDLVRDVFKITPWMNNQ